MRRAARTRLALRGARAARSAASSRADERPRRDHVAEHKRRRRQAAPRSDDSLGEQDGVCDRPDSLSEKPVAPQLDRDRAASRIEQSPASGEHIEPAGYDPGPALPVLAPALPWFLDRDRSRVVDDPIPLLNHVECDPQVVDRQVVRDRPVRGAPHGCDFTDEADCGAVQRLAAFEPRLKVPVEALVPTSDLLLASHRADLRIPEPTGKRRKRA